MKYFTLLALSLIVALIDQPEAEAKKVAQMPPEDGFSLPWGDFVREETMPGATTKLLATFHIGMRLESFHIPITNCGNDVLAINLKVKGASVSVQSFGARFSDGANREFALSKDYEAGTESGWIDLSLIRVLDQRCPIDVYAKAKSNGAATVLVYGSFK